LQQSELIALIRGSDGLTVREIVEATGRMNRVVLDSLERLIGSGRVRKYKRLESRSGTGCEPRWGEGGNSWVWVFSLHGEGV
jgi:hypothetical protein